MELSAYYCTGLILNSQENVFFKISNMAIAFPWRLRTAKSMDCMRMLRERNNEMTLDFYLFDKVKGHFMELLGSIMVNLLFCGFGMAFSDKT